MEKNVETILIGVVILLALVVFGGWAYTNIPELNSSANLALGNSPINGTIEGLGIQNNSGFNPPPQTDFAGALFYWFNNHTDLNFDFFQLGGYDNNFLVFSGNQFTIKNKVDLNELGDVNIVSPSLNQVLSFDGNFWVPSDLNLAASDVNNASYLNGQNGAYYLDYTNLVNTPAVGGSDGNIYSLGIMSRDNNSFLIDVNAGTKNLRTDKNAYIGGNVGIGTTSPSTSLHVAGTTAAHHATLDTGLIFSYVVRPPAFTVDLVNEAGLIPVGTYWYYISYVTALGETNLTADNGGDSLGGGAGEPGSTGITTDATHGKVNVNVTASTDPRVTGIKIYRSATVSYNPLLVDTISNTTQTYVDNKATTSGTISLSRDNTTNKQISINATPAMFVGLGSTYFGYSAGGSVTSGGTNAFFGTSAGGGVTSGSQNTYVGSLAGYSNSRGVRNVAIGQWAMLSAPSGSNNTAVGQIALRYNTGSGNTALGANAGYNNVTGENNIFLGFYSGYRQTAVDSKLFLSSMLKTNHTYELTESIIYGDQGATPASQNLRFNVANAFISDTSSLGTEKLTDPTAPGTSASWTRGAAWQDDSGKAKKYQDGTSTLSQTSAGMVTPLVIGEMYYLSYIVSGWTVGTVTPSCGGVTLPTSAGANGTYVAQFIATSTANLVFTPTNTSRFIIDDVSLKKISGGNLTVGGTLKIQGTSVFDGNIGIGTNRLTRALSVVGDINASGANGNIFADQNIYATNFCFNSGACTSTWASGGGASDGNVYSIGIMATDNNRFLIDVNVLDRNVYANRLLLGNGDAINPSFTFNGDRDTGLWSSAANTLDFSTGGTSKVKIMSNGDVNVTTGSLIIRNRTGLDYNMTVLKDADLVGLTKTYCDMNFIGGILVASTC